MYVDPTSGEVVCEFAYLDPDRPGEVRRQTHWFGTWAQAAAFVDNRNRSSDMRPLTARIINALDVAVPVAEVAPDSIGVGHIREDGLWDLAVIALPEGGFEIIVPAPGGPQQNLTDQVTQMADERDVPDTVARIWREINQRLAR